MANKDRIKRQLLRDLVAENVDLAEGRLPRPLIRARHWRTAVRASSIAVIFLALLGSSRLLYTLTVPRPETAAVTQAPPPPVRPAPAAAVLPAGELLVDPKPVDAAVFPLAVRKVVIDPGHGGESLGTRDTHGLLEKDLTLDIAVRLRRLLEKDFQVLMTREADRDVALEQRGRLANQAKGDIFVSIHVNWLKDQRSGGVETYYLGPTNDPDLNRLAASENRGSGYSMADMRQLLNRLYAGVRQDRSRKLAETVQVALYRALGKMSPEIEDRGVKAAPFIVLLTTEMPAILAEVASLSNEEEARLLTKPLYRQYIAEALAEGIRGYAKSVEGGPEVVASGEKGKAVHER
jgi:N-acetylmuramoyl-L-alanine amidase